MNDKSTLAFALNNLREHLPHHAEEGTLRESMPENDLIAALQDGGLGEEMAELLVAMLRLQFDSMALLDRTDLAQDRWTFVSFPASLLARSLTETWASGQSIVPADYWDQGDHRPAAIKEEQRTLLHRIESERLQQNPNAHPIRMVHVAWAFIRLGDHFLLHRREDRERTGEKTHVLPGGRFNPGDLSSAELKEGPAVLRKLLEPNSQLVDAGLDRTLVRELEEELGLRPGEDYTFQRWMRLPPYRDLAGTGNRHAYTEYAFQLYTVKLTAAGEVRLLGKEYKSSSLAWFSIEDLSAPRRADGASAYIDALHAAWGRDIASQLASIEDSGALPLAMQGESHMLDLPFEGDAPWMIGKLGKEKLLPIPLAQDEWQLLMLLGWHARGFAIHAEESVRLLGGGWVHFEDETAKTLGQRLLIKTRQHDLPLIEIRDGRYLRLSIGKDLLMLASGLFSYAIEGDEQKGGVLHVCRNGITTPWGELAGEALNLEVNRNTLRILRALERGEDPLGRSDLLAGDWERNLRQQLTPELRRIGLRKLWVTENKASSLVDGIRSMETLTALR